MVVRNGMDGRVRCHLVEQHEDLGQDLHTFRWLDWRLVERAGL
jgi:hypothetical protein